MKSLIFDIDGTVLDSMYIWIEPMDKIFAKYNFKLSDLPKERKGEIEALPFEAMCEFIAKNVAYDMSKDEVIKYFVDNLENAYRNDLLPKDGAVDFIKDLKKAGYKISVASSTDYIYLEPALKRIGIYDCFDFFATPDITKMKKSDDSYWKYSIDKHKKNPEDIVLFDDALYAIKASKRSGIKTIGVKDFPWNENEWEHIKNEADTYTDRISAISIDDIESL